MRSVIFLSLLFAIATGTLPGASTIPRCTRRVRELDGFCTSRGRPEQRLWGSADRIFFTNVVGDARVPVGSGRPSARLVSNSLFRQRRNIFDRRRLNEMAAYFGQFLAHDLSDAPLSDDRFDIPVPRGDAAGTFTDAIPFLRSRRDRLTTRDSQELPINQQTSAVDLSVIYGASKGRNNALRTGIDGTIALTRGDLPPISSDRRLENLPEPSTDYFLSGDPRANENPVLTSLHTIFAREHNRIAAELRALMPDLPEEELFMEARLINSAQFQKIVFEEWYPAVTNEELPLYTGFEPEVDPTVSVTFSTAGFQAHHSMTGRAIRRRGPGNVSMSPLRRTNSFFRTVSTLREDGVEPYLRGAFTTRAQAIDAKITPTRRDGLYSNIRGLENRVDIAAEIIQRGRDHGIPSYNKLRTRFGIPKAVKIKQITSDRSARMALKMLYSGPSTIDAYAGMLAEDSVEGLSMGPTMMNLWKAEFVRLRDGDRFYFRSNRAFTEDVMDVPTVKKLLSKEDTFRRIVLENTMVRNSELPRKMFFAR